MKTSEFFGKLKSMYFWGNILAMIIVVAGVCWGTSFAIDIYTHHGESVAIPNIKQKSFADAERILADAGLSVVVSDTGYVKSLPPDCILEQSPAAGSHVKTGHVIYVIVNASRSPEISLPDIIDNSSLREAMAKLSAMGFKLAMPQRVPGEKDWVYGVTVHGRNVVAGDKIAIDAPVVIQAGNGLRDESDSVDFIDPIDDESVSAGEEVDEFEEVTAPPVTEESGKEATRTTTSH